MDALDEKHKKNTSCPYEEEKAFPLEKERAS